MDYVSLKIWSTPESDGSDSIVTVLANILKRTPDQLWSTLSSRSLVLKKVAMDKDFKRLVRALENAGFGVKVTRLGPEPDLMSPQGTEQGESTSDWTMDTTQTRWQRGDVIEGLYEVLGSKGGGMGRVHFVFHRLWKMMLAIKTPLPHAMTSEKTIRRFLREAEFWVHLGVHPNIATCYYARVINGLPRLFIEYVNGGSLAERMEKDDLKDLREIVDLMLQFCHGMIHAEQHGMIHRDVKPANCLLTRDGMLKITDFGLVKRARTSSDDEDPTGTRRDGQDDTDANLTLEEDGLVGSPWYMAPERFRKNSLVDIRADIYSFGIMLYELAVGSMPFRFPNGFSLSALARAHLKSPPVDPCSVRDTIPPALADLVMACLEKKADNRFSSFVELCGALESVYSQLAPDSRPRPRPNVLALKADSLNNQAVSLLDLGREDEARKLLEDAHSSDTDHLQTVYNLDVLRWAAGETSDQEIVSRMQSLKIETRGTPDYKYFMGLVALQRGDAASAVPLLQEASQENPNYSQRWIEYDGDPRHFVDSQGFAPIEEKGSFAGHVKSILAVAFSSDGSAAHSLGEDRSIRTWDLESGRCLKNVRTFSMVPRAAAFSRDSRLAAIAYGQAFKTLDLWEVSRGERLRVYPGIAAYGVRFSPDSRFLAAWGEEGRVHVLETDSGKVAWATPPRTSGVAGLEFAQAGESLLIGREDGTLELWLSARPQEPDFIVAAHTGVITALRVSVGGSVVATGGADEVVRLWDAASGRALGELAGHHSKITALSFMDGDRYLVSAAGDGHIKMWDIKHFRCCRTISLPGERLTTCAVSGDEHRLLIGAMRGSVRLWTLDTGWFDRNFLEPAVSRPRTFQELARLHDSFTQALDSFRKAWREGRIMEALEGFERIRSTAGFAWSKEAILIRNLIIGPCKPTLLKSSAFIRSFEHHEKAVTCLDVSDNSLLMLSGSRDRTAALWDVVTGSCTRVFSLSSPAQGVFLLGGDLGLLTYCQDGALRRWHLDGHTVWQVEGISPPLLLWPDRKNLLALSRDHRVVRVNTETGQTTFLGDRIQGKDLVCFSSDGAFVYGLHQGTRIHRSSTNTGSRLGIFRDLKVPVTAVCCPEGNEKVLAGLETGEVLIYVTSSGLNVASVKEHTEAVRAMDITSGGRFWATGSDDCSLRVWDLPGQKCLAALEGHPSPVNVVRFFANQSMIASGGNDGALRLWGLEWEYGLAKST
ncbi:MAG: protein kinase [Thermodesulfobacteriota bacterium]